MAQVITLNDKPLYRAEQWVVDYLEQELPDDAYTIYTGLQINGSKPTHECEIMVVTPYAIYAVEVKNSGGVIRIDGNRWTTADGYNFRGIDPRQQVLGFVNALREKIKRYNAQLEPIFVQGVVCLAGEDLMLRHVLRNGHEEVIDPTDPNSGFKHVRGYKDLPEFLLNPQKYGVRKTSILHLHPLIEQAVQEDFFVPSRVGSYQIEGGAWFTDTCRTYYAKQEPSPKLLLLKVYPISPALNAGQRAGYVKEIQRDADALLRLQAAPEENGNGIAPKLVDQFEDPNRGYVIVTEWAEGTALEHVNKIYTPAFSKKYDLAWQLCQGLAFIHRQSVVHRNLHPGNLIYNKQGRVRIVNFDYARFITGNKESTLKFVDPKMWFEFQKWERYRAPELTEQAESYHQASPESDKYSLGVILWELFTKETHPADQPVQIDRLMQPGLHPDIPPIVEALCAPSVEDRAKVDLMELAQRLAVIINQREYKGYAVPVLEKDDPFLNSYRIETLLADTLYSRTYKAVEPGSGRRVVIKFLSADWRKAKQEIERASEILRDLSGRYTANWISGGSVSVYQERIVPDGTLNSYQIGYEIIEFIEGLTLKDIINGTERDGKRAIEIGGLLLEALGVIHNAGWIHKDIKPDNLILTLDGYVKVVDFGMSRRISAGLSSAGMTYGYTPPNVLPKEGMTEDAEWQPADDIYSAAATIVALICGERRGSYGGPLLNWHTVREKTNGEIAGLLQQQLDPNPANRCQSAEELREALEEALERMDEVKTAELDENETLVLEEAVQEAITRLNEMGRQDLENGSPVQGGKKLGDAALLKKWLVEGLAGDCPVNVSLYGLSLPGVVEPVIRPDAAEEPVEAMDEEEEQRRRLLRIQSLIGQARDALEKDQLNEGVTFLASVFKEEPDNEDAQKIDREIRAKQDKVKIDALVMRLETLEDIGKLDKAVDEARKILANLKEQKVENPRLQKAFDENYSRYEKIKGKQEGQSTQAALGDYADVLLLLGQVNAAVGRGEDTWADRTGSIVQINQFIEEVRAQLAEKVLPNIEKHLDRARDAMPSGLDAVRTPALAVDEIKQALSLEGLGEVERILQVSRQQDGIGLLPGSQKVLDELNNTRLLDRLLNTVVDLQVERKAGHKDSLEKQLQTAGVAASPRRLLETLRDEYTRQLNAWELAGRELELSIRERSPLVKLQHWKQANQIYPYHCDLQAYKEQSFTLAVNHLTREINRAVRRAEEHLSREAREAVQVSLAGGTIAVMKSFDRARDELKTIREETAGIGADESDTRLGQALKKLDDCEDAIRRRQQDREQIFSAYQQVTKALDEKNVARANEIYLALDVAYKNDPLIELLEPRIRGSLTDDQHLDEANKWLTAGVWQKCIDECSEIKDAGIKERAEHPRQLASIELLRETILTNWQTQYYETCYEPIERLANWSTSLENVRVRWQQITGELKLDAKREQIQQMREANQQNDASHRIEQISETLPELRDPTSLLNVLGDGDSRLERVLQARGWIVDLVSVPLTYKGQLRDWQRRVDAALREQMLRELEALRAQPAPDLKRAFRFAQALRQNGLLLETAQVELCRWALVAYYEQQDEALRMQGNWSAIIQNWEKVARSYPDEYALRERLNELRHEYLLITLDQTLLELDQPRAKSILYRDENPCVFDQEIPYHYNLETDPALQERLGTLTVLEDSDIYLNSGAYEEAIHFTGEKLQQYKDRPGEMRLRREAVYKHKIEQIRHIALDALHATGGDETRTMPERAYAFARVLGLSPTDVVAQHWLTIHDNAVRFEIQARVRDGQELEISAEAVKNQLVTAEQLLKDLQALSAACRTLNWISHDDVQNAVKRVEEILGTLRAVNRQFDDFSPQGHLWLGCLGTGEFSPCENAVSTLQDLLHLQGSDHLEVLELKDRLARGQDDRRRLLEAKERIKTDYHHNEFTSGLEQCNFVDQTMLRYGVMEAGKDPFRIFTRDLGIWDNILERQVFYYARENQRSECIRSILQIRLDNLTAWQNYYNCILARKNELGEYPTVRKTALTLAMKEAVERYFLNMVGHNHELHKAELDRLRRIELHQVKSLSIDQSWLIETPEQPNSRKAREVSAQASTILSDIQSIILQARSDWLELEVMKQQKIKELDELLPSYWPSPENLSRLNELQDFFAESSESDLIAFIAHLKSILTLQNQAPSRRR